MAEIARFSGRRDWVDLDFVERERTQRQLVALGIRLILLDYHFQKQFGVV